MGKFPKKFKALFLSILFSNVAFGQIQEKEIRIYSRPEEVASQNSTSFVDVLSVSPKEHGKSVSDFLKTQKGITVRSQSSSGSLTTANIRGIGAGKAERVLVLLDGVRLNTAQGSGVDLSRISLSSVEKIEILRGGESALYGSDAIGGVINIVTRKNGTHPQLTYGLSDHSISLSSQGALGQLQLFLNGHGQKEKGDYPFKNPLTFEDQKRENNQFQSYGGYSKALWQVTSKTSFSVAGEFFDATQHTPGSLTWPQNNAIQKDKRMLVDLKFTHRLANSQELLIRLPIRKNKMLYSAGSSVHKNNHLEPQISFSFPYQEKHLITLLGQTYRDKTKSTSYAMPQEKWTFASALKDDYFITPLLMVTPATRLEHSKGLYTVLSPKLGAKYQPLSTFFLKANLSHSFRAPAFDELYWNSDGFVGNTALIPEKSWDGDIGFSLERFGIKFENSLFASRIQNLIDYYPTLNPNIWTYRNLETNSIWGSEASLESLLPIVSHLYGSLNYTWLNNRAHHTLNSALKWKYQKLNLSLNHQYLSAVRTNDESRPTLPSFYIVDLGGSYEWAPALTLTAQVENILNRAYERIPFYPMPGRTFSLSVSGTI
ncbi:MAG: TonB-dependent receptor [Deltaproteobacteria bacterium]|nr:TonB-dependent receptor [Deltaproteobacteria bacterium]